MADQPPESLGAYIISNIQAMFWRYCYCKKKQVFFTCGASVWNSKRFRWRCMNTLFNMHWYKQHIQGKHWSVTPTQQKMLALCLPTGSCSRRTDCYCSYTRRTVVHGRGGSISRGGAPTQQAHNHQVQSLAQFVWQNKVKLQIRSRRYCNAKPWNLYPLEATLLPPPEPKAEWRETVWQIILWRFIVKQCVKTCEVLTYCHTWAWITNVASRPAKRKVSGGIESLRAIYLHGLKSVWCYLHG